MSGQGAETFKAARYTFRVQEFDPVFNAWVVYPVERIEAATNGYWAREAVERLNCDYEPYGRRFRLQRCAVSDWQTLTTDDPQGSSPELSVETGSCVSSEEATE